MGQKTYQSLAYYEPFYHQAQKRRQAALDNAEYTEGTKAPEFSKLIKVQDLVLSLGGRKILNGASFEIPAGSVTTIFGPSGAGKTTLTDVLLALYRPDSGSILIDGVSLNEIDLIAWRHEIGYVPQELFLFHDTVLLNVTLGDDSIDQETANDALRRAGAWDFIAALPDGVNTVVGERGAKLSGGQRQRIAIARALARQPRLLILDEPTTALDPVTEREICQTLRALAGDVTILAISHQPALTEIADHVLEVANGTVQMMDTVPTTGAA